MIPQSDLSWQTQSWQEQSMHAVRSGVELLELLEIPAGTVGLSQKAAMEFPVLAPYSFISRIKKGDAQDPLLLQILNGVSEEVSSNGYLDDPLNESDYNPIKGVIRKYKNRALFIVTGKCAINCRYCFRRAFPYQDNNPSKSDWLAAIQYLTDNPEIDEVILSGGDPLSAPDRHLRWLIQAISAVQSIKRLRIHTRLPIVIPDRVTKDLCQLLQQSRLTTTIVLHCNHANEIDCSVKKSVQALKRTVDFLLNQSVLLKDINDNLDAQIDLQHALTDIGVQPYYLHLMDPINGAAHFDVDKPTARALYKRMQARLSGYMLPKLAVEQPGAESKLMLAE